MPSLLKVFTLPLIAAKRNGALDKQLDLASLAGFGVYTSTLRRGVHPKIALQVAIKTGANVPKAAKMARKYASSRFTLNPEEKDDLALKTGIKLLSTSVRNNLTGIPMYARNNIMAEIQNLLSFAAAFDNVFAINPKNKKLKGKGSFNSWVTKEPLYGGAGGDEEEESVGDSSSSGREEVPQDDNEWGDINPKDLEAVRGFDGALKEIGWWSTIKKLASKIGSKVKSYSPSGKQILGLLTSAMIGASGVGAYNYFMRPATTPIQDNSTLTPAIFPQNGTLFRYDQPIVPASQDPYQWAQFLNATRRITGAVDPTTFQRIVDTLEHLDENATDTKRYLTLQREWANNDAEKAYRQNQELRRSLDESQANATQIAKELDQSRANATQIAQELDQSRANATQIAGELDQSQIYSSFVSDKLDEMRDYSNRLFIEGSRQRDQIQNLTHTIEEYEDKIQELEGEIDKLKPDRVIIDQPSLAQQALIVDFGTPTYDQLWGRTRPWDIVKDGKLFNIPDDWLKELNAEKDPIVRWREFGEHVRNAKATKWQKSDAEKFDERMKILKNGMNKDEIHAYESGQNIAEADITAKGNDTYQSPPGWWDKYGNAVMEVGKVIGSGVLLPLVTSWAVNKRIKDGINNGESAYEIEAGIQRIAMGSQAIQNLANIAAKAKMEGARYDKEFQHQRMVQRYELAKHTAEQNAQRANAKRNALIAAASTAIPLAIGGVPGLVAGLSSGLSGALGGLFGNRAQAAVPPAPGALPPAPGGPGAPPPAQGPLGAQINHPLLRPIDADVGAAVLDPGAAPGGPLVAPGGPAAQQGRRRANRDRRQIRENLITFSDLILTDAEWNQIKNELFAGTTIRDVDEAKNTGLNTLRGLAMDTVDMPGEITRGLTGYYNDHRVDQAIRTRNKNRIATNLPAILGRLPYYIDRTVRYIEAMEAGDENAAAMVAASQKKEGKTFVENFGKISQMINALNPTIKQLTEAYKPQTPYLLKPFELPKSQYTFEQMKAPTIEDLYGKEITIHPPQEAVPQYDYVEQVSAIPYGTARHLSTNVQPVNIQAAKRPRSATNSNRPPKRQRGNRGNWSSLE